MNSTRTLDKLPPSGSLMKRTFGCRYAVLLFPRFQHAAFLQQNGWRLKCRIMSPEDGERTEGWIFALDPREAVSRHDVPVRKKSRKKSR